MMSNEKNSPSSKPDDDRSRRRKVVICMTIGFGGLLAVFAWVALQEVLK